MCLRKIELTFIVLLVALHSELLTVHRVAFHVARFWVGGGGIRDWEMRGWGGGSCAYSSSFGSPWPWWVRKG